MRELLIRGGPSRDAKLGSGVPHAAQIESTMAIDLLVS